MTDHDRWLDQDLDDHYLELLESGLEIPWPDEPAIEPNNDYDDYDGWDDMQ
jgi:hypothetical protein